MPLFPRFPILPATAAKSFLTLTCALGFGILPALLSALQAPVHTGGLLAVALAGMLAFAPRPLVDRPRTGTPASAARLAAIPADAPSSDLRNAAARTTPDLLLTQPLLPRFHLECCVGRGASATVYRAHRPGSAQSLTLKLFRLPPGQPSDEAESLHTRFFREARTARALRHPHIIRVDEVGVIAGQGYMALEWFEGGDLSAHARPGHLLAPATVLKLMAQAANALQYAHRLGVVHRDIKPANLLFDAARGVLRISDFGVARVMAAHHTQTGMVLGTLAYMSPEQLAGQKIDGRSDIYSLVVTMFQLLTGVLPFSGASLGQLMHRIVNDPPPAIRSLRAGLPPGLDEIVARGLGKTPLGRYAQAGELAQALVTLSSTLDVPIASATLAAMPIDIEL